MLTHLDIRNIVLIDHLALDFKPGLSALTGETGAGKSILLDAVGLLRGDRADGGLVRKGAEQASVSAGFDVPATHLVHAVLREQGIVTASDEPLVLRRVLLADGKSRAFINDQAVTVGLLKTVGTLLIDLHGQFDTSDLLKPSTHRDLLDQYGGLRDLRRAVAVGYADWQAAHAAYLQAQEDAEIARREEDYLRDAVAMLNDLAPEVGEEELLLARKNLIAGRAQIVEGLDQMAGALDGDGGATEKIAAVARVLERLRPRLPAATVENWLAQLDGALSNLHEVSAGVGSLLFDTGEGGESVEVIEDRLYSLRSAARRYACPVDDLPAKAAELATQLSLITDGAAVLDKLMLADKNAQDAYVRLATKLSAERRAAAKKLNAAVMDELPPLKLDKVLFETEITTLAPEAGGPTGVDNVRFIVATNPGSTPGPLDKIASGGEMSRLMLALKVVMAAQDDTHLCMVFDEVDSGIGGAVAAAMADRLSHLAATRQVLVVTHAPQVAARADHHFIVAKEEKEKTVATRVMMLRAANDRREEIARMLSGAVITNEARAAAQKLLEARVV